MSAPLVIVDVAGERRWIVRGGEIDIALPYGFRCACAMLIADCDDAPDGKLTRRLRKLDGLMRSNGARR